jgi:hypothetical protein
LCDCRKKRRKQKKTPSKEESRKQFAPQSVRKSRATARTRIHVEREMIRIKNYRIFTQIIPVEYKDILDDMVWIAVCLGNFGVALTSTEWEETVGSVKGVLLSRLLLRVSLPLTKWLLTVSRNEIEGKTQQKEGGGNRHGVSLF